MLVQVSEHVTVEPVRVPSEEFHTDVMTDTVDPLKGFVRAAGETHNVKLPEVILALISDVRLLGRHTHVGIQLLCVGH